MAKRRWKIWNRGGSCGVEGPLTTIDFNRAEKVDVVEAVTFDALLSDFKGEVKRLRGLRDEELLVDAARAVYRCEADRLQALIDKHSPKQDGGRRG